MKLSSQEKSKVDELYEERVDINWITRSIFGGYTLEGDKEEGGLYSSDGRLMDGRCREGRAVKSYLIANNKNYNTTKSEAKNVVELSVSQKEFLMSEQISSEMQPIEIARVVFEDENVKALSTPHRLVLSFLEEFRPDIVDEGASLSKRRWTPPKSLQMTIRRVNKWCDIRLKEDPECISSKYNRYIGKLLEYYGIFKLSQTINSFKTESDRELFESEFVRATWDKPDLTVDEINLYMMICSNYVRATHIQKRLDCFNSMLENEELESGDLTMRLTENVKATNEELNACEKRIESITHKLNGSRADRLKNQSKSAGSIVDLVREVQEQEGRKRLYDMAQQRAKLVKDEAERIESLDEFKARVFGISQEELL